MSLRNRLSVMTFLQGVFSLLCLSEVALAADPVYMDRPFATAALAGVERFEADLERLSTQSGNREPLANFHELQTKLAEFVEEIDKTRAFGGVIVLHREKLELPAVVLMLPVVDGVTLVEKIQKKLPFIQKVAEGAWHAKLPRIQIHILHRDNYLLVTQELEVLSLITSARLADLNSSVVVDDVIAHLDFSGLSETVQKQIMQNLNKNLDKEAARKPEESDEEFRLRSELLSLIQSAIKQVLTDTDSLTAGIQLTDEVQLHLKWNATVSSVLANQLNHLQLTKQKLTALPKQDVPLQIQFGFQLPKALQSFALEFFHAAREDIRKEIGPKLAEKDRGPVSGAFDAIHRTIDRGSVDGIISFQEATEHEKILVAGLNVVAEDLLATSMETILPYARDSDGIAEVEMNVFTANTLKLHRLQGKDQRVEDRRIYGESAALYVGTSSEAFWIANGGKQTPALIESLSLRPQQDSSQLVKIDFSLDPWLRLAEKHQRDLEKIRKVRSVLPNGEHDQITFELKNISNGLNATLKAEQGYFKLFGLALKEE